MEITMVDPVKALSDDKQTEGSSADRTASAAAADLLIDETLEAMAKLRKEIDALGTAAEVMKNGSLFAEDSLPPLKRNVEATLVGKDGFALSAGAYVLPNKSGEGKTTSALAVALDISCSMLAAVGDMDEDDSDSLNGFAAKDTTYAEMRDKPVSSNQAQEYIKYFLRYKKKVFRKICWWSINEPASRRITVKAFIERLIAAEESIILVDSINDSIEEYALLFKDSARKGGWTYSQLDFISVLNSYAEVANKILILTVNTDFFPMESMLGRTEGEIYARKNSTTTSYSTRLYGRKKKQRNTALIDQIALRLLGGSTDPSNVSISPTARKSLDIPISDLNLY
jgi:hypothetical protein